MKWLNVFAKRTPNATSPSDPEAVLGIVYTEVGAQVDDQLRQIEAADTKAGILLGLSGALSAVVLSPLLSASDPGALGHGDLTLLIEAGLAGLVSIGMAYVALWPRTWYRDPSPRNLTSEYEQGRYTTAVELLSQLTSNLRANFAQNEPAVRDKTRRIRLAQVSLGFEIAFAFAAAVAHLVSW